jgi:hypothetical protein
MATCSSDVSTRACSSERDASCCFRLCSRVPECLDYEDTGAFGCLVECPSTSLRRCLMQASALMKLTPQVGRRERSQRWQT